MGGLSRKTLSDVFFFFILRIFPKKNPYTLLSVTGLSVRPCGSTAISSAEPPRTVCVQGSTTQALAIVTQTSCERDQRGDSAVQLTIVREGNIFSVNNGG